MIIFPPEPSPAFLDLSALSLIAFTVVFDVEIFSDNVRLPVEVAMEIVPVPETPLRVNSFLSI